MREITQKIYKYEELSEKAKERAKNEYREFFQECRNDFFYRDLKSCGVDKYGIVFIHCREPEEIERFEKELGAKSVFIDREESKKEQSNHADSRVENHSYTYIIDNNEDLEHLRKSAETFIKILRGELKIDFSI